MFNINIMTNIHQLKNGYVVYQIHEANTLAVEFVGVEKLSKVFQLSDLYSNNVLKKYMNADQSFGVQIVAICDNKGQALKEQSAFIRQAGWPAANKYAQASAHGMIVCNETGDEFRTIAELCSTRGLDPAAVSRHLRNVPGHPRVKGKTYTRKNFTKM